MVTVQAESRAMANNRSLLDHEASQCDEIPTQWELYSEMKSRNPTVVFLLRQYNTYYVMGKDATRLLPILKEMLTRKDAETIFCYSENDHDHAEFSFDEHNFIKVAQALLRSGQFSYSIIDYDMAIKDWGGWKRDNRIFEEAAPRREQESAGEWVQATLFDIDGFM